MLDPGIDNRGGVFHFGRNADPIDLAEEPLIHLYAVGPGGAHERHPSHCSTWASDVSEARVQAPLRQGGTDLGDVLVNPGAHGHRVIEVHGDGPVLHHKVIEGNDLHVPVTERHPTPVFTFVSHAFAQEINDDVRIYDAPFLTLWVVKPDRDGAGRVRGGVEVSDGDTLKEVLQSHVLLQVHAQEGRVGSEVGGRVD